MSEFNFQVRRATVDDLVTLRKLWQQHGLPASQWEKRFQDFQVVETANGEVLGALGVQIEGTHGKIYAEAFSPPELAAELRARLWDRVQTLARHHRLVWLWTSDNPSLFWLEQGFEPAGSEQLRKLPEQLKSPGDAHWLARKMREEGSGSISIDQEFEIFRLAQSAESERVARRTRALRILAAVVVLGVLLLILWAGSWVLSHGVRGRLN